MKVFQIVAMAVVCLSMLIVPTSSEAFSEDQALLAPENYHYKLRGNSGINIDLLQELLVDQVTTELEGANVEQEMEELMIELQSVPFGTQCKEETLQLFMAFLPYQKYARK